MAEGSPRDGPYRGVVIAVIAGLLVIAGVAVIACGGDQGTPDPTGSDGEITVDGPSEIVEPTSTDSASESVEPTATGGPAEFDEPIPIDGTPIGLAVHDDQVSVVTRDGATLVEVEKTTRDPGEPILLPGQAEDIAVVEDFAYVTMPKENAVAKVSLSSGAVVSSIPVGEDPRGIVASGDEVWVANLGSSEISRIDSSDGVTQLPLDGATPGDVALGEAALWITDRLGDRVIRRDLIGEGEEAFGVGDNPKGVIVDDGVVWVANTDEGTITRLNADGTGSRSFGVCVEPRDLDAAFERIWVACGDGTVVAIDPETDGLEMVAIGGSLAEIAAGPKLMWVTNEEDDALASIEP